MNSSVFLTYSLSPAHLLLHLGWMQAAVKDSFRKCTPWSGRESRPLLKKAQQQNKTHSEEAASLCALL